MLLFFGLSTDVHFSGDETGLQWEDYLFELQNAVEWRMVMLRGEDERSQMHAMSVLLNTCSGMTNRVLIDDGARWILEGDEQLVSKLSAARWRRLLLAVCRSSWGLSERNGRIAFWKVTRAIWQDCWSGKALRRVSVPVDIP